MKSVIARLKPLLRWVILGAAIFFLVTVLHNHWQSLASIRIDQTGWSCLAIALGFTLLAHICAGWVWSRLLDHDFRQPIHRGWVIQAYLQTNVAKYLPGNIWHYYGRVNAAIKAGASLETATITVLLEPLLMATSALILALFSAQAIANRYGLLALILQWITLGLTLATVHPKVLNPILQKLAKLKQRQSPTHPPTQPNGTRITNPSPAQPNAEPAQLDHYPLVALLGNLGFVILRGLGFLLTFLALSPINPIQIPTLLSAFSFAWLLGLVVPGAPGGLGIFEATAIALLGHLYSPGLLLGIVAFYRLISVASEGLGAGLAWCDQKLARTPPTI